MKHIDTQTLATVTDDSAMRIFFQWRLAAAALNYRRMNEWARMKRDHAAVQL